MKKLDPAKVLVQYRNNIEPYKPLFNRKYTVLHSDATGELFVYVGNEYANDKINSMRDEVIVDWKKDEKGLYLMGKVLVDGGEITGNANIRNKIFLQEMPTALQALRQADRFLFIDNPMLDNAPVYIQFISDNAEFNKCYDFGTIGMYA